MVQPFVAGWAHVPANHPEILRLGGVPAIEKLLTVKPKQRGRLRKGEEPPKPIPCYRLYDRSIAHSSQMLALPVYWAMSNLQIEWDNQTTAGHHIEVPRLPTPRDDEQADFFNGMVDHLKTNVTLAGEADTGVGKTVGGYYTIGLRGRTALVVVNKIELGRQWKDEGHDLLGLPQDAVRLVHGSKTNWEGAYVVICTVQSLVKRRYPVEFYRNFGTIVFDELHNMAAQTFNHALPLFNAEARLGLSANHKRKDGAEGVYQFHLGPVGVVGEGKSMPLTVHVMPYQWTKPVWGDDPQTRLLCLRKNEHRNEWLTQHVMRFHEYNRQALIMGHSIEHLEEIAERAKAKGLPADQVGMFTGEFTDADGTRRPTTPAYLKWVKENARYIFATYGMFKEAQNVPRLDAGMDISPLAEGYQVVGRVRRLLPEKLAPFWITPLDRGPGTGPFIGLFKSRLKDYQSINAEIINYA